MAYEIEIPGLTLHGNHIDFRGKQYELKNVESIKIEQYRNPRFLLLSLGIFIGAVIAALQWANRSFGVSYDSSSATFGIIALILLVVAGFFFVLWRLLRRTRLVIRDHRRVIARVPASKADAERFIREYALIPRHDHPSHKH